MGKWLLGKRYLVVGVSLMVIFGVFIVGSGIYEVLSGAGVDTQKLCLERHVDDKGYEIVAQDAESDYEAYFGKSQKGQYLDIYYKGKYFGGSDGSVNSKATLLHVYDFAQQDKLIVVWGENSNSEIGKYTLSLPQDGNNIEVWKIDKNIHKVDNIVDIYLFKDAGSRMKYHPDIEFMSA